MVQPKILLTRRWPTAVEEELAKSFQLTVNKADRPMSRRSLKAAFDTYDAICPTVSDQLGSDVLPARRTRACLIANYGVGVNHIDLEACRRAGLVVTNTPDVLTDSTADLAMLLLMMVARRAGEGEREIRSGDGEDGVRRTFSAVTSSAQRLVWSGLAELLRRSRCVLLGDST